MNSVGDEEKIFCNKCSGDTFHRFLKEYSVEEHGGPDEPWSAEDAFQIWQCCGCKTIKFRQRTWFSEWQNPGDPPGYKDRYFPPDEFRKKPDWFSSLREEMQELSHEVYVALQNDQRTLAAIGIRTLLDVVMVEKIGDIGGFEKSLGEMEKSGHITVDELDLLKVLANVGNAAAHRGFRPEKSQLIVLMDIIEGILHKSYIVPQLKLQAEDIDKTVPPRKRK